jgi:hypothetical protein
VTGQVTIPSAAHSAVSLVTGAADDRSFIVGADETGPAGSVDLRLFRLHLTSGGRPGYRNHPGLDITRVVLLARAAVLGSRLVAFTWWHDIGPTGPTVSVGLRQLDTATSDLRPAPGAAG